MISDVVFDCFGTLVQYTPDVRAVEVPASYQVALGLGFQGSYDAFAAA